MPPIKFSPLEEKEICRLYVDQGLNKATIAKQFKCADNTVGRLLRRNNIKLRGNPYARRKIPDEKIELVKKLLAENKYTDTYIAKKVGIANSSVGVIRKKDKVKKPTVKTRKIKRVCLRCWKEETLTLKMEEWSGHKTMFKDCKPACKITPTHLPACGLESTFALMD